MKAILSALFGCAHARFAFPQTELRRGVGKGPTTQCCLTCGARFAYSWDQMRIGAQVREEPPKTWRAPAQGLA